MNENARADGHQHCQAKQEQHLSIKLHPMSTQQE